MYYTGGNIYEIKQTIAIYIAQLETMKLASHQQPGAAHLTSQAYQLAAMISLENEDYPTALAQANHAIDYAQAASDPNIIVAAISRKATVLYYQKRLRQMGLVMQQAIPFMKQISPLMQARLHSDLGTDLRQTVTKEDITRHLKLAVDVYPSDVESDPAYAYTHTSPYILYLNQEIAYTNLGMHKDAWEALERAEQFVPAGTISTRRLELLTHQVVAAMEINNLDLACNKMEQAIHASKVINTGLWYSDIEAIYQRLQGKWRHERLVRNVGEILVEEQA
jgi:tetratricopeptide (TPR) repeat protein